MPSSKDVEKAFKLADPNGSNFVDLNELTMLFAMLKKGKVSWLVGLCERVSAMHVYSCTGFGWRPRRPFPFYL